MYELLKDIFTDLPKSPWVVVTLLVLAVMIAIAWKYIASFVTQKGKIKAEELSATNGEKSASHTIDGQTYRGHRFEFSDGVVAYARLRISYEIVDYMQLLKFYRNSEEVLKKNAPLVYSKTCYLLEKYSYGEAKLHREEAEVALKNALGAEFVKWGIRLDHITIGHFERLPHEVHQ